MEKLRQNIVDVIEEGQLKLGYREETMRLYYPLSSLCGFAGKQMDAAQMQRELEAFFRAQAPELGRIQVSRKGEKFCLAVPPQGVAYVHAHTDRDGFLSGLIQAIEKPGCTLQMLLHQFHRYSDHVHLEALHNGEFDYLIYFEDGVPDGFRYCIADEGNHMTYHRFTKEDYEAFGF